MKNCGLMRSGLQDYFLGRAFNLEGLMPSGRIVVLPAYGQVYAKSLLTPLNGADTDHATAKSCSAFKSKIF